MGLLANPVYCVEKSTSKFSSVLTYGVPVYLTTKMTMNDISKEIVYLKSIRKADGEIETHVFDNTKGETLTRDYLYFVKVTDLQGNVTVEESRIYAFDEFPHQTVYGMCDAKCKVPVPTKAEYDEFVGRLATVDLSVNESVDAGTDFMAQVKLPTGFTKDNCCILSTSLIEDDGTVNDGMTYAWVSGKLADIHACSAILTTNRIQLRMYNPRTVSTQFKYTVRYLLYRYK